MLLNLLYWIILILSILGVWIPDDQPRLRRGWFGTVIILFIIIGLRSFEVSFK